jgi:magnesium chelatase family protein
VEKARKIQKKRFKNHEGVHCNAQMSKSEFEANCQLNEEGVALLKMAMNKLGLSARAYDRIIKVSRTIADLDESQRILPKHLAEAIQYRSLDRSNWSL